MASLVDIARAMDKEKASREEKPPAANTALSLVDIAKAQQQPAAAGAATKPLTLIDVARKADATKETTASAVSLQSLAREINDEERERLDSAITKAATDVKHEKAQQRADALKAATDEVLRDEQAESQKRQQPNVRTASSDVFDLAPKAKASPPPSTKPPAKEGANEDGYSSFEDDAVEPEKAKQAPPVATKPKQKRPVKEEEPADNQSDSGSAAGPEKTTPSGSPLAKEFLRAIYRGDARRVRDMMRDEEDLDANTADQHGWSALHWAASQGQSEILSLLLEKNARVDAIEHVNGWTALHLAVLRDAVACAKKLLHADATTTVRDLYGDSAYDLLRAVKGKKKERWLLLLDASRHK